MTLNWATVMANMAAAEEDPTADASQGWWDRMGVLIATQMQAAEREKDQERAEEWTRLTNIEPDGRTLHFFNRNATQGWDYVPYNGDVLVDWATTVVLARDNPALLGTIH